MGVIIITRRQFKEDTCMQWRFYLVVNVVGEITVRKDVLVQVMLKVRLDIVREIPQFVGPHEHVERRLKECVAALGYHRVRSGPDLVGGFQAAETAPAEDNSGASAIKKPWIRDFNLHFIFEEMVPLVPN